MSKPPIKPALTPEEWADFPNWPLAIRADGEEAPLYFPTRHGIAATNLHGQPFGFSREDVAALRYMADKWIEDAGPVGEGWVSDATASAQYVFRSLAARIEALLPPDTQAET